MIHFLCVAKRDIEKGEELLKDYGHHIKVFVNKVFFWTGKELRELTTKQ